MEAIRGGADCIQVREKTWSSRQLQEWGEELQARLSDTGTKLVVNDNLEVAMALSADGVHLGQEDMLLQDARRLAGEQLAIGISTHDLEQLAEAEQNGANYVGFGPIFPSATKAYSQGLGLASLQEARSQSQLPILAIGGITPKNSGQLPKGLGMAVSSAICASEDPFATANDLLASR